MSQTPAGTGYTAVAAGGYHSLALRADGSIVSWGSDRYGQVSQTPAGTGYTAVAAGASTASRCGPTARSSAGGMMELARCRRRRRAPGTRPLPPGAITASRCGPTARSSAGGYDDYGQVSQTPAGTGYTAVAAGDSHSLALRAAGAGLAPLPGCTAPPSDLDGDGLYEDVNGNARADFADVVLYFNQMTWIAGERAGGGLRLQRNGRIDFADVVWLFNHL